MAEVKAGSTDFTTYFMLVDPTSGDEELNLDISDLVMFYTRNQAGNVSNAAVALNNASDAHSDWEMWEIHSDNAPGLYRADYPDAAVASGVDKVVFGVRGTAIATATQLWTLNNYALSDVMSELSDVISDYLVKIYSDTTLAETTLSDVQSDTNKIVSDLVLTSISDLATASAVSDVKSELVIISDAISTLDAAIDSDSLLYVSDLSDIISELATGALSTIASDTAAIEAAGGALTAGQASDLAAIESDLKKTPLSDLSDTLSDILVDTATISDLATASAVSDIKSELVVLSDAISDVKSELATGALSTIASDTAAIEAAGGGLTAGQASDLAAIESDLKKTPISDLSDTLSDILLDTATISDLSSKQDSDMVVLAADHDKTQSDVADLSTKLGSDVLALEGALDSDFLAIEDKLDSDMVLETADHDKTQSDIADLSAAGSDWSGAQRTTILSDLAAIETDTGTALPTKLDSDMVLEIADHDKTQSDIADLASKADSDALLVQSDISDVKSELTLVHSETTAIQSDAGLLEAARAEPGQGAPAVNADVLTKIDYLYKAWRNRTVVDANAAELYDDAGTTVDQKWDAIDDGAEFTKGEVETGP